MFKTNYKDVDSGSLLPEGEYEVTIIKAELRYTKTNNVPNISLDMVIREDVQQMNQRRHIFDSLFKSRETGMYNMQRIQSICKCAGLPEGDEYPDEYALCNMLMMRNIRIVVKQMMDDYKGEKVAKVHYYKPPQDASTAASPAPAASNHGMEEVEPEDDLPF